VSARVAVFFPYWDFWEASVGGHFRRERSDILADVAQRLGDHAIEAIWRGMIDSPSAGKKAAREVRELGANVVLIVQTMAVPPAYTTAALDELPELPVVIWAAQQGQSLPIEFDAGDITRMGATVGVPQLTNVLSRTGRAFSLFVGAHDDPESFGSIATDIRVGAVAHDVAHARIGKVGQPIAGYDCVDVDPDDLLSATGIELVPIEPAEVRDLYQQVSDAAVAGLEAEVRSEFDVEVGDRDALTRTLRLAAAMGKLDDDHGLAAGAMNCHVAEIRFGDEPGITPCFGLGRETTRGIPWTCVGDVVTAVAMLVTKGLSGAALYHEVEAIDFETGEVAIANSGEHDLKWCNHDCRPRLIPNPWFLSDPNVGGSAWFELPAGPATMVGFTPHDAEPSGFRLIAAEGDITSRSFPNSPTVGGAFRFAGGSSVGEAWQRWAESGVNHHSAVGPGHIGTQVATVAHFLGIGFMQVS